MGNRLKSQAPMSSSPGPFLQRSVGKRASCCKLRCYGRRAGGAKMLVFRIHQRKNKTNIGGLSTVQNHNNAWTYRLLLLGTKRGSCTQRKHAEEGEHDHATSGRHGRTWSDEDMKKYWKYWLTALSGNLWVHNVDLDLALLLIGCLWVMPALSYSTLEHDTLGPPHLGSARPRQKDAKQRTSFTDVSDEFRMEHVFLFLLLQYSEVIEHFKIRWSRKKYDVVRNVRESKIA